MKSHKLFFLAALSTVLNCFSNADFITKSKHEGLSVLYTYYKEFDGGSEPSEICSLVLKPGLEVDSYCVDSISLVVPNNVSYVRSLLFNVINGYRCKYFCVNILGDLSSRFRDTKLNILDKNISEICKSLGFKVKSVDKRSATRTDVFLANTSKNNTYCYRIPEELCMFKSKTNLKNINNIPVIQIKNVNM